MNYKLAKKLKDAGFPQLYGEDTQPQNMSLAYWPTLSELIKACQNIIGEQVICIGTMFKENNDYELGPWHAATYESFMQPTASVFGPTPEEAVANLWLKLNEK